MTARPPRMPPIPDAQMTEAQKAAVKDIVSGPRGHLVGPFIPLLRSPDFMNRLQKTGEYLRFNSALEPRRSEMVILMTARVWSQVFEWHHHRVIAEKAGLATAGIASNAEVRQRGETVVDPRQEHVVAGELLEPRTHVHKAMDECLDVLDEIGFSRERLRLGGKQNNLVFHEVVEGRVRHSGAPGDGHLRLTPASGTV